MKELIKKLKKELKHYTELVKEAEDKGLETLDYTDTELYGVYLGKKELLEDLIPELEDEIETDKLRT